ncbi:MAG: vitamin K epoxide reductase family protein [Algisphaera sp.]
MSDAHRTTPHNPQHLGRWKLAAALAGVALLLSGYLAAVALTGDGRPAGCGDAAGCGQVLTSRWSKVVGLPTAVLATGLYAMVLVMLVRGKQLGGLALATAAGAMLGAAGWFTGLQVLSVGALCKYCLATHTAGIALAAVLLRDTPPKRAATGMALGFLGTAVLAATQLMTAPPALSAAPVEAGAGGQRAGRVLTLLNGGLTVNLAEERVSGDPDSKKLLVEFFDYACPHCRHAHGLLAARTDLARVYLPVPLNPDCNSFIDELPMDAFAHSCDLALTALALHHVAPDQMHTFDDWAFGEGWPRTADQALAFAKTLADPAAMVAARNDPKHMARLKRNVNAWGTARDNDLVGGLPVLMAPGGGLMYGPLGDGSTLDALFDAPLPDASDALPNSPSNNAEPNRP